MGILDFFNQNAWNEQQANSPYTPEMRMNAGMQQLGLLGGSLMAAGAPSTNPGQFGQAMGQYAAQAGPQMQQSLDSQFQMGEYQKEQERQTAMEEYLASGAGGILSPEEKQFLGMVDPSVGAGLLGDRLFAQQGGDPFTLGAGDVRYDASGNVIATGPDKPFSPDIETIYRGDQAVQGYFDASGQFVEVGGGSRFAPTQAPAASYTNFASRDGDVQSVDLSTDAGRARAAELTSQGYFKTGANISDTFGGLSGDNVMAGPVDQAGKPIAPAKDHEWFKNDSGNWAQRVIEGTPSAVETDAATASQAAARDRTLANSTRIIGTIDEALGMIQNQDVPITGPGGVVADALMLNTRSRAALEGALLTIKANLGFEELQAMRAASPTGGALGQVAVQELEALQSTIANLNPDMGETALASNLNKIKQHYNNVQQIIQQSGGNAPADVAPELWEAMTPEERALWQN